MTMIGPMQIIESTASQSCIVLMTNNQLLLKASLNIPHTGDTESLDVGGQ